MRRSGAVLLAMNVLGALFIYGGTLVGSGRAQVHDEILAKQVRVVGEDGEVRARLEVSESGGRLVLTDQAGNDRVWVGMGGVGPRVELLDERGEGAVLIHYSDVKKCPIISLQSKSGFPSLMLSRDGIKELAASGAAEQDG